MNANPSIVVVGGGYAGSIALGRLRMQLPNAHLTLVDPGTHAEARIELHRVAAGRAVSHVDYASLCADWDVEHLRQRLVRVTDGLVLEDRELHPDAVLLALGSRTRPPLAPAHLVDDEASATALRDDLRPGMRVTVIGAGTTALEVVTALAVSHPDLHLTLWGDLTRTTVAARERLSARLVDLGIHRQDGRVLGWDAERAWSADTELEHDLVVWCGGFVPRVVAGLGPTGPDGRLALDPFLQWRDGWFVAGDLGCPPKRHRMGCATALPMGAHAADNLVRWLQGERLEPFRFRDVITCTDLAGGHGLVEPEASDTVFAGRTGGLLKAGILGYVRIVLAAERRFGHRLYRWPRPRSLELADGHRS